MFKKNQVYKVLDKKATDIPDDYVMCTEDGPANVISPGSGLRYWNVCRGWVQDGSLKLVFDPNEDFDSWLDQAIKEYGIKIDTDEGFDVCDSTGRPLCRFFLESEELEIPVDMTGGTKESLLSIEEHIIALHVLRKYLNGEFAV